MTSTPCCGAGAPTSATATRHRKFGAIDGYVHERLARLASRKHGLPGPNWSQPVHLRVADRSSGSIASPGRCATRDCACLAMNDVGEPCAGEPHARFDRGPLGRLTPMARRNMHPTGNRRD